MSKYIVLMHHDVDVYNVPGIFSIQLQYCKPSLDHPSCLFDHFLVFTTYEWNYETWPGMGLNCSGIGTGMDWNDRNWARKLLGAHFCSTPCQFWNIPANSGLNGTELTTNSDMLGARGLYMTCINSVVWLICIHQCLNRLHVFYVKGFLAS